VTVYHVFQDCYHLKDWLKNDPESAPRVGDIEAEVSNSFALSLSAVRMRNLRAAIIGVIGAEYVEFARAKGLRPRIVLLRHVLPNALPPVMVNGALQIGGAILTEAGLSFLGLGDRNQISWGYLLNNAQPFIRSAWWMSVFPGVALLITVIAVNLVGDGLNDALNPRLALSRRQSRVVSRRRG